MANKKIEKEVEIDTEELEEKLPEGVKITSVNDNKIKSLVKKTCVLLGCLAVLGGVCLAVEYGNSSIPEKNYSIQEVIDKEADYTILDEVISNYDGEKEDGIVTKLDNYVRLVNLSEQLHEFDLGQITEGLEHLNLPEGINVDELQEKIDIFNNYLKRGVSDKVLSKDSEDFVRLALYLEAQEKAVNLIIQGSAYNDLANLKLLVLKSKVADCCDLGTESVNNMALSTYDGERMIRYYGETGKVYNIRFGTDSRDLVIGVMNSVFSDQAYSNEATTSYNGDINARLIDEINSTKTLIRMNCEINKKGELELTASPALQRVAHIFRKPEKNEN